MMSVLPLLLLYCLDFRTEAFPVEYSGKILESPEHTPTVVENPGESWEVQYSAKPEEPAKVPESNAPDTDGKPGETWEELEAMMTAPGGIGAGWSEVSVDANFKSANEPASEIVERPTFKELPPPGQPVFSSLSNPLLLNLPLFEIDRSPIGSGVFQPEEGTRPLPQAVIPKLLPPTPTNPPPVQNGQVDALCHLDRIYIRIKKALFSRPGDALRYLRVGTCPVNQERGEHYYFLYYLRDCGRTFMDSNLFSTYSTRLTYQPPSTGVVLRDLPFSVDVNCKYYKNFNAYAYGFNPDTRSGTIFTRLSQASRITLSQRDDQFNPLPPGQGFVIGRPMFFEVSLPPMGTSGVTMRSKTSSSSDRIYVNKCYMTAASDPNSSPRFVVINKNGCMEDSRAVSTSRFIPCPDQNKLRFSIGAFVFPESTKLPSGQRRLYMHCELAIGPSYPTPSAKSCTFNRATNMWTELSGANSVCACCDSATCPSDGSGSGAKKMVTSLLWDQPEEDGKIAKAAMPDKTAKAAAVPEVIDADDSFVDEFEKYWMG